ncbi:Methyltransferase [Sphingomonas sp. EC-HK361]|uniref:class I SAM-dependent methyltransferase n=1 Tax=Sphingomonas sp. EC-HK361 TaxID=2038397 RepID=UPI001254BF95|nr:methyltransferase domain-containing protein [Sphingomonas sp. EC-HK361]VVS98821.1 Methyltransferase [Sphingomonas sp. EC-HK361]
MPSSIPAAAGRRARTRPKGVPGPWGIFFKGFVKHPRMVGSIIPSSDALIARMLGPVDWASCKLFVEFGPGVGTFCRPILDRMAPDARLIAIDTNPDFVRYLRHAIVDPRFAAVSGSAADVETIIADHGHEAADYVLSGIPFSTLPDGVGESVASATHRVLRPGGAFLIYQVTTAVRDVIAPHFARIDHAMEWWNIPPEQLYWAWKD